MTYPITSSTIAAKKHLPRGRYSFRSWCLHYLRPSTVNSESPKKPQWPRMATDGDLEGDMKPQPCWLFRLPIYWLTNLLTHWLTDSLTKNGCCVAWQVSISIQKSCCFLSASEQLASALSWASRLGTDTLRQPSTTWWSVVGHSCRVRLSRDAGKTWPPPEFLRLGKAFESG